MEDHLAAVHLHHQEGVADTGEGLPQGVVDHHHVVTEEDLHLAEGAIRQGGHQGGRQ